VVRLDCWERAERDERADLCETGRELGVRVSLALEPHCCSALSSSIFRRRGVQATDMTGGVLVPVGVGARGKKKDWELVEVG
jgi:hypothetical protein